MNKLLASSSDPKQLSLTVRGILVAIVPLVATVIKLAGGELDGDSAKLVVDTVSDGVFLFSSAISAVLVVVGLVRKVWNSFK